MSLDEGVIKGTCYMCEIYKGQLKEAQETLSHVNEAYDSVKSERDNWKATAEAANLILGVTMRELEAQRALAEELREEVETLRTAVNQHGHVVEFREDGWAIEHPIECRKDNLLDCPLNFLCEAMGGPPEEGPGRYKAAVDDTGNLLLTPAEALSPQSGQEDDE